MQGPAQVSSTGGDGLKKVIPVLLVAAVFYLIGLSWGLPCAQRSARVLLPGQRADSFYRAVESNRRAMYSRIGLNLQAAFGRGEWSGSLLPRGAGFEMIAYPPAPIPSPILMHGFSSFILRSVEQDEQFVLNTLSHFRPKALDFNPHETLYGGAYIYPIAGLLAGLHLGGCLRLSSDAIFYYRDPDQLAKLYKAGRIFSATACLGCIVMTFLIGRALYEDAVGWWACALFALSPAAIAFSHVMKPHLPGALLALACLHSCARAARLRSKRDLISAGVFFGLATGAIKYLGALVFPVGVAVFSALQESPARQKWLTWAGLSAAAVAVFFLANPYALADWRDLLDEMRAMSRWYHPSLSPLVFAQFVLYPLRMGLGPGPWACAIVGALAAFRRRTASDQLALLLLFPMLGFTAFQAASTSTQAVSARFCFPEMALILILGCRWALSWPRWGPALLALLLAFDALQGARYDANFSSDTPGRSNSFRAGSWIEANLGGGVSLGMDTPAPMLDRFPPLPFSKYKLVYFHPPLEGVDRKELPDYFVTNASWVDALPGEIKERYGLLRVFDDASWGGFRFQDAFTSANFPVALFAKRASLPAP